MDASSLFAPVVLPRSGIRLSNRLVMAPMPTFAANVDGSVGTQELAYYSRRACDLGAIITAGCAVSEDGLSFPGQWRCDSDALTPSLSAVAEAVKPHTVLVLQLSHGGSPVTCDSVEAVIASFKSAALRASQAGFHAVEIHGGHRYLVHQFFSRRNINPSDWGGPSVAQRARLPLAIVEACSEYLPCWYRLDPEEVGPDGISFDETVELATRLAEVGVQVFDVSAKRYAQGSIIDVADRRPRAALLSTHLRAQALVMAVGGIETAVQATTALSDGCGLVGLGSVLLAHPDWARDARKGYSFDEDEHQPTSDTLVSLAVPKPVVRYLVKRGRVRDDN